MSSPTTITIETGRSRDAWVAAVVWVLVAVLAFVLIRLLVVGEPAARPSSASPALPRSPVAAAVTAPGAAPVTIGSVTAVARARTDADRTIVTLALDTHAVDLGAFNLTRGVVLRGGGTERAPLRAERSGTSHHQQVTLTFPATPVPLALVIRGLDGIAETVILLP